MAGRLPTAAVVAAEPAGARRLRCRLRRRAQHEPHLNHRTAHWPCSRKHRSTGNQRVDEQRQAGARAPARHLAFVNIIHVISVRRSPAPHCPAKRSSPPARGALDERVSPRVQEQLVVAEAARGPLALDEQYAVVSVRHSRAQLPLRSPPEPALPRPRSSPHPRRVCRMARAGAAAGGGGSATRGLCAGRSNSTRNPPRPCTSFRFELCTT